MSDYGYFSKSDSPPDIDALASSPLISFDVEATGTDVAKDDMFGASAVINSDGAYWFPIGGHMLEPLASVFKLGHNVKYDRSMFKKAGIELPDKLIDTLIAGHLLEYQPLDLKTLYGAVVGRTIKTFPDIGKSFEGMDWDDMAEFSGAHSLAALQLWEFFEPELRRFRMTDLFYNVEMPLIPVLSDMELDGVMVDPEVLVSLGKEFRGKMETIKEALNSYSGDYRINYNSPDQVAHLLFNVLKLPPGRPTKKTKRPSTEAKILEKLKTAHPIVPLLLKYKQYDKLRGTYADGLLKTMVDGRIHGSFNQEGTRTGRLSSSGPNLQNIPKRTSDGRRIRLAFVAPPGHSLLMADNDQLELRVMAHCAQDLVMLAAFRAGKDIHTETALRAFGDVKFRSKAKTLNYQVVYGGGEKRSRDKLFEAYPGIGRWIIQVHRVALEDLYVRTLGGRIRRIPELRSDNQGLRKHGMNEAISTIVQGSSAEIVKIGMRKVWEQLRGSDVKTVLQVHDELVFEVPDSQVRDLAELVRKTLTYNELTVPLPVTIKVGKSWGNMEEIAW